MKISRNKKITKRLTQEPFQVIVHIPRLSDHHVLGADNEIMLILVQILHVEIFGLVVLISADREQVSADFVIIAGTVRFYDFNLEETN